MRCDNPKCNRVIEEREAHFIARRVPAYGATRIMQTLWERHKTFCSMDCLTAFIWRGGEL